MRNNGGGLTRKTPAVSAAERARPPDSPFIFIVEYEL
ncbi:hypothetical protein R80B4_01401 [Fibrobacteres bacterium R8-0-B4]